MGAHMQAGRGWTRSLQRQLYPWAKGVAPGCSQQASSSKRLVAYYFTLFLWQTNIHSHEIFNENQLNS